MNIELNVMSTMITRKRWRRCLEYDEYDDDHHHDSEYEDDDDAEAGSGREVGKEQKTLAITFHLRCSTQQGQVWYFCILVFCILFLYSPIFIFVCHLGNTSCKKRMFSLPELPLPGRGLPPIFSDNGQKNFFRSKRAILRRKTIECTRRNRWPHLVREMWQKTKEIQADYSI